MIRGFDGNPGKPVNVEELNNNGYSAMQSLNPNQIQILPQRQESLKSLSEEYLNQQNHQSQKSYSKQNTHTA